VKPASTGTTSAAALAVSPVADQAGAKSRQRSRLRNESEPRRGTSWLEGFPATVEETAT
jgi:hypothetical protein